MAGNDERPARGENFHRLCQRRGGANAWQKNKESARMGRAA